MNAPKELSKSNRPASLPGIGLSVFGFVLGAVAIGWQMWFAPQYVDLQMQGRLNEGDSARWMIGLLTVPTLILAPMFVFTGLAMSFVSFIFGWRRLATFCLAVNLIGLIVYLVILFLVFR